MVRLSGKSIFVIILTLAVGALDCLAGGRVSVLILYLVPVYLGAAQGLSTGAGVALLATLIWWIANGIGGGWGWASVWNATVRLLVFLTFIYVINLQRRLAASLATESALRRADPLTGVYNRLAFVELATRELTAAERHGEPLSLAYMDLDDFKRINDTAGHAAGDRVLMAVADVLKGSLRSVDIVSRLGGDEFAIMMPRTGAEEAKIAFSKVLDRIGDRMKAEGGSATVSVGLLTCREAGHSLDELLSMADELMYEAKGSGKNKVVRKTV